MHLVYGRVGYNPTCSRTGREKIYRRREHPQKIQVNIILRMEESLMTYKSNMMNVYT